MEVLKSISLVDEILLEFKSNLGIHYESYKNHILRVLNYSFALQELNLDETELMTVAACFHDLGLWTENTLDYLPPSTELANQYLLKMKKDKWISYVDEIIINHHKLTAYKNTSFPLVEVFRKADSIDLSKGLIHFGLNKEFIKKVNTSFPNSGFHNFLFHFSLKWILKNPLNPAPIFKW